MNLYGINTTVQPETKQKTTIENVRSSGPRLPNRVRTCLPLSKELENDLRAQGFAPFRAGTLSAIAREQNQLFHQPSKVGAILDCKTATRSSTSRLNHRQHSCFTVELLWPATELPTEFQFPGGTHSVVNKSQEQTLHLTWMNS